MQVTLKRTAFINGTRYRGPGVHEYFGSVDDLPGDALVDGKPIPDREVKKAPKISNVPVDETALREKLRAELLNDADLRKQIEDEVRQDEKFLDTLREEIRVELSKDEPVDPKTATTAPTAGPFSKDDSENAKKK